MLRVIVIDLYQRGRFTSGKLFEYFHRAHLLRLRLQMYRLRIIGRVKQPIAISGCVCSGVCWHNGYDDKMYERDQGQQTESHGKQCWCFFPGERDVLA